MQLRPDLIDANRPVSIPQQLRTLLLRAIREGTFKAGDRLPSERSLAEQCGISRTSVRETITELLSEGVLSRMAGRGTFVSKAAPRCDPKAVGVRQIGFWIGAGIFGFVQPGYNQILTGVGEVCRERGYRLQFHAIDESTQSLDQIFAEDDLTGGLDGNLVVGGVSRGAFERLRRLECPLIAVDLLVGDEAMDAIRIDYATGTRMAVEHLRTLGHTEIGFIGFSASQKYEAFWQSLEACGLTYHPRYTQFLSVSELVPGVLAGFRSMQKLIGAGRLPTALLVTNDYVALGVMEALAIADMKVPKDISVVGYDDLGLGAQALTTIKADLMEVGRIAANALIDQLEKGDDLQGQVLIPVQLLVRGTTAPPLDVSMSLELKPASPLPPISI
ncbi:MAG TPA: GntR family transcriptional regulator [Bryobacteraceae bacterium]|nr:GntR family transcriptional regulator [Bryobacteraceae bacterium]HWR35184.1 GntR family transcriptional regulator [Clostridia bacterium]